MSILSPPTTHTLGECHGQLKHSFSGQTDFHRVELLREGATLYCSLPFATPGPAADACTVRSGRLSRLASKFRGVLHAISGRGRPDAAAETVLRQRVALHDVTHLVAVVVPTAALRAGPRGAHAGAEHGTWHSIVFYDPSTGSRRPVAFRLDHEFQRDVACLAFAPSATMSLALGCRNGLCVWNVDGWTKSPRGAWVGRGPGGAASFTLPPSPQRSVDVVPASSPPGPGDQPRLVALRRPPRLRVGSGVVRARVGPQQWRGSITPHTRPLSGGSALLEPRRGHARRDHRVRVGVDGGVGAERPS